MVNNDQEDRENDMEHFSTNQLVEDRHNELRRVAGKRRTEARWLSATWRKFVSAS